MAGFFDAVSACVVLLLMMAVGYGMGALGWMTGQEKRFVNKFIMNVAVPCNCLSGLLGGLDRTELVQAGGMVAGAFLSVVASLLCSALLAALLKLPRRRWGVFVAMAGFSNTLFIGIPVCTQLFGDRCIPYVMLYYLPHTLLLQSVGILLIQRAGDAAGKRTGLAGFCRDVFTKPPILSVLLALLLLLLGLELPGPILRAADYISGAVTPLALLYCGFILYEMGLKDLRLMRGHGAMLAFRLVAAPAVCLAFCRLFGISGLAGDVFVVESALPVVSQVTVMAGAYGADEEYAASGACISILCSFITIPILMLLLGDH